MTKHEALRAYLMGQNSKEHALWVEKHQPLLSPELFTEKGRRLNRFCVGSDPEFALEVPNNPGQRTTAADARLTVGLAVGADQNERLVELRPWPSHSVVEHVAGILTCLRWLYRSNQYAFAHTWRAGAYFAGDGMGGHVHFGRKRPTREAEVLALDGLAYMLRRTGLFPMAEWARRAKGDEFHNRPYGQYGDFRQQQHGYEYRTLPSWLQTPRTAFIAICASKLAVLDPEVTKRWPLLGLEPRDLIRGLAKLYKGRDDDAYLLYHILTAWGDMPFNINHAADFKAAWGIPDATPDRMYRDLDRAVILPSSVKPQQCEIDAVRQHLLTGEPLRYERVTKNFRGEIPGGYQWAPNVVKPARRSGFGDFLHNLVFPRDIQMGFDFGAHNEFQVHGSVPCSWSHAEERLIRDYRPNIMIMKAEGQGTTIIIPKDLCQPNTVAGLRAIIFHSGLFPIWTVDQVQADSYQTWIKNHKQKNPPSWKEL